MVVGFVLPFGVVMLHLWIESIQLRSFQNRVYCELLAPDMTYEDVNSALLEIEAYHQQILGEYAPDNAPSDVAYYRVINWESYEFTLKHNLRIGLGYNKNDQLVWLTRDNFPHPNSTPITCPLYP